MQRLLEPEWLDQLPPCDARARRSRSDLRRVNFLMGNARHVAEALAPLRSGARPLRLADLGAGDGRLMRNVARRLRSPGVELTLVDRLSCLDESTSREFSRLQWKTACAIEDVHAFLARPGPRFDAMVANLFLHHFEDAPLRRLLGLAARRTRLFVACEPRRSRLALQASRLLGLIGCNDVTRHDAAVSVRAGFRGRELCALWPPREGWRLAEGPAPPFAHLFVARRDASV